MVKAYRVEFMPGALADLEGLDRTMAQRVLTKIKWLSENFEYMTPELLRGECNGLFKLRVGDFQVLYTVNREDLLITIHLVGHRSDIYK